MEYKAKVEKAVRFIQGKTDFKPQIAIILGTGLGGIANVISPHIIIPYREIPYFPVSTAPSHQGQIILGTLEGKNIMAFQGRVHYYEGYSLQEVSFSTRVAALIGTKILIISNAAGGLNPLFREADLMAIVDHINLMGDNPLRGQNIDEWGVRFPDMVEPYDKKLIDLLEKVALKERIKLQKGVYVAVAGPSLETAAETRFLRLIGADAVGMSTVPEVIAAIHHGLRVLAISVITNVNLPDNYQPAPIEKVVATAQKAETKLTKLICCFIKSLEI
ncbi:purine nucleoside phosphorylase I, inosine and guanosine-specific [Candidatus Desulfofervidus auxilii]|uniref:Purine nucleoside phosphorylase n=1 Tax=Desulfofervidus auxilii TaxID=1621989 RepID=A0A7U4QKK0_DESA2|nr:purine-nucleoside phosphorylase [Candidatus Desulfofervidus auxilii]AMM41063.1 purine nucleoside phosphorylase I, inosine and guanosine-specific [Candidatus Desulfofervidus auxilii]